MMDNCRTEIFFLYMILSNSIFMYYILNSVSYISTGKYWYIHFCVYISFWLTRNKKQTKQKKRGNKNGTAI